MIEVYVIRYFMSNGKEYATNSKQKTLEEIKEFQYEVLNSKFTEVSSSDLGKTFILRCDCIESILVEKK